MPAVFSLEGESPEPLLWLAAPDLWPEWSRLSSTSSASLCSLPVFRPAPAGARSRLDLHAMQRMSLTAGCYVAWDGLSKPTPLHKGRSTPAKGWCALERGRPRRSLLVYCGQLYTHQRQRPACCPLNCQQFHQEGCRLLQAVAICSLCGLTSFGRQDLPVALVSAVTCAEPRLMPP